MLETPIIAALGLLVLVGIVWWLYQSGRDASTFYIAAMIGRPCRPDPDMNWLWRTLLPDTRLPTCGSDVQDAGSVNEPSQFAAPSRARRTWLRKLWPLSVSIGIESK
jgi:hypothetical protein